MNYQESRAYIRDAEKYGSVLGLDNMREMMKRLGDPQEKLKIIHVAGTNGKGSVIAYLYNVLLQAGYRVGRYISPTLYSYRERMEISKERISRESFASCLTKVACVIKKMTEDGLPHPTPFEIETAVAFLFFAEEGCDFVLLEVGMGGDLDATNIITRPALSVLTAISMDHMGFLGNTLGEIAEKKAGIIKKGCPMITTVQKPEAREAIQKVCRQMNTDFCEADKEQAVVVEETIEGQCFSYKGEMYQVALAGIHQKENAVLALEAITILKELGAVISVEQMKKGLSLTNWNGRFTIIHKNPMLIVDGAHNPAAAEVLAESVRRYFPDKKLFYIMGMFRDKDYETVIKLTCPYAKKIFTIQTPDNPRAMPADELAEVISAYHPDVTPMDTIQEAVEAVFEKANKEDVILAFGSLSFIGALTEITEKREDE